MAKKQATSMVEFELPERLDDMMPVIAEIRFNDSRTCLSSMFSVSKKGLGDCILLQSVHHQK